MKSRYRKSVVTLILSGLWFAPAASLPAAARQSDPVPRNRVQEEYNRKVRAGALSVPDRPRQPRLAMAQIREDFRLLQAINRRVQDDYRQAGADQGGLLKSVSELRKRARRLRENLVFLGEKSRASPAESRGDAGLDALLKELDERVYDFVSNQMFRNIKVVDAGLASKAEADLDGVIELSGLISALVRKGAR